MAATICRGASVAGRGQDEVDGGIVNRGQNGEVVPLDYAPTHHTLILSESASAYALTMEIDVVHQPSARRYIVTVNGVEAGEASYVERDNELLITHTFIDPTYRNQGLGAILVHRAIDDIIATSERVITSGCWFVTAWL